MSAAVIILLLVAGVSGLVAGLYRMTTRVVLQDHLGEAIESPVRPATASIALGVVTIRTDGGQRQANANFVRGIAKAVSMSWLATANEGGALPVGRCATGGKADLGAGTTIVGSAAMKAAAAADAAPLRLASLGRVVIGSCDDPSAPPISRQERHPQLARILHLCRLGYALAWEGLRPALLGLSLHPLSRGSGCAEGREHKGICPVPHLSPSCPCFEHHELQGEGGASLHDSVRRNQPEDLAVTSTIAPIETEPL